MEGEGSTKYKSLQLGLFFFLLTLLFLSQFIYPEFSLLKTLTPHHLIFHINPIHTLAKMSDHGDEISQVTFEQLAAVEDEFEDIDTQISTSITLALTQQSPQQKT